ncbi:MAG: M23 family metallopeptidase [Candidatus Delongbacteria bacterium]|jgi:murein DD-endopeptidase MepM/ murein hydrolase activator NlpD|nr:M23 family metallopeptidase [Candidatus Delongbacteria bacterium]
MAEKKYKLNPSTLRYESVNKGFKYYTKKALPFFLSTVLFGVISMALYMQFFESPTEQKLINENEFLSKNLTKINNELDDVTKDLEQIAKHDNHLYRVIYQMDSIPAKVRSSGFGGTDRHTDLKGHQHSDLVITTAQRIDKLSKQLRVQKHSFNEISEVLQSESERVQNLPIIQPVHNKDLTRIGSYYGMRLHPILGIYKMHEGIDLTAPTSTPVFASGGGTVVKVEHSRSRRGYGNLVIIDHGYDGLSTRYAHLNSINVKRGQKIDRGDKIGTVGNTGLSTAPHLHYEIRRNGETINPLYYYIDISPDQYDKLLQLAQLPGKSFD